MAGHCLYSCMCRICASKLVKPRALLVDSGCVVCLCSKKKGRVGLLKAGGGCSAFVAASPPLLPRPSRPFSLLRTPPRFPIERVALIVLYVSKLVGKFRPSGGSHRVARVQVSWKASVFWWFSSCSTLFRIAELLFGVNVLIIGCFPVFNFDVLFDFGGWD